LKNLSLIPFLNTNAEVYGNTSFIHDYDTITDVIDIDRQPGSDAYLKFKLASLVGGITISITGELDDAAVTETIHVASSGYKRSTYQYDTISSIYASGYSSGSISIEAVAANGVPIEKWEKDKEIKVRLSKKSTYVTVETGGAVELQRLRMYSLESVDEDNRIVVAGITYAIKGSWPYYEDFTGNISYYSSDVDRIEGT